jgi:hypothetical protein
MGETVNWLSTQWMMFLKDAPYKIFYNISIIYDVELCALDLSSKRGQPPEKYKL